MTRLGHILQRRSEEVVERWLGRIQRKRDTGAATPREIVDHIPHFLATLADELARLSRPDRTVTPTTTAARAHGSQRYRIGFDLATVVAEYGDLQDVLLDMLEESGPREEGTAAEIRVLCQHITAAIGEAVTEYVLLLDRHRLAVQDQLREDSRVLAADSQRKDEFLAILGHELRNPLAPIVSALEVMAIRSPEVHVDERKVIERQAKHLTRLVDDLLDVSRIARGKVLLHRTVVELSELVQASLDTAGPYLKSRAHEVHVEVPATGMRVHVDEARLVQIITNLLTNAARFSDHGGRITVSALRTDREVTLEVADEGRGISAELLPNVFSMFFQAGRSRDELGAGLGLGLTIARSLTELHGGRISVDSAGEGQGSRFVVALPTHASEASPDEVADAPSHARAAQFARILVVDDNLDAADTLADGLRALGHRVAVAYDGPTALALARESPPDVALLDIGLPGMDGYEVARRLRTIPGLASVRLASVSGFAVASDNAADGGSFEEHFPKPVRLSAIASWLVPRR